MDVQTILKENLNCPTLHVEMAQALSHVGALTAGKLALAVLKQNGLKRAHLSTREFELLRKRIREASQSNKRFESRVEIIGKNQQTVIKIKSCLE
jgi:acyl-[acyl carrier protein]--UDP-N-acetylglucosamine O-acyltransferase